MIKFLRRVKRKIMIHKLASQIADLILMGYSYEEMEPVIRRVFPMYGPYPTTNTRRKEIIDGMAK